MKNMTWTLLALAAFAQIASALTVKENEVVNKVREVSLQQVRQNKVILADAKGISLYTFDLDTEGKSNCSDGCLTVWPPLHVAANAEIPAPFGKITGNDGQPQLTLKGLPLYYYMKDKKPGDTLGNYPKWQLISVEK